MDQARGGKHWGRVRAVGCIAEQRTLTLLRLVGGA